MRNASTGKTGTLWLWDFFVTTVLGHHGEYEGRDVNKVCVKSRSDQARCVDLSAT